MSSNAAAQAADSKGSSAANNGSATGQASAATSALKSAASTSATATPPLIPLHIIDAPTQRVYLASAFLGLQAYKCYRILYALLDVRDHGELGRLLLVDLAFIVTASRLHTPRFDFTRRRWIVLFCILAFVDWTATGGWRVVLHSLASLPLLSWLSETIASAWTETFERQLSISEHHVRLRDIVRPKSHILGQHTIHLLPHSSASFLPVIASKRSSQRARGGASSAVGSTSSTSRRGYSEQARPSQEAGYKMPFEDFLGAGDPASDAYRDSRRSTQRTDPTGQAPMLSRQSLPPNYCLDVSNPRSEALLPILFSNAEPHWLSYSITPVDSTSADDVRIVNITIPRQSLIRSSQEKDDALHREDKLDLALEDAEDEEDDARSTALIRQQEAATGISGRQGQAQRRKKPSSNDMIYNLPINRDHIGRIRLERVLDRHQYDVRLSRGEVVFVECPRMGFLVDSHTRNLPMPTEHYCPGDNAELDVWVKGVPPMELAYRKVHHTASRGAQVGEKFTISQITGQDQSQDRGSGPETSARARTLDWAIPRNISLPLTLDTSQEGLRSYVLEEVRDALGNIFEMTDEAADAILARDIHVHARPVISFDGCSSVSPVSLLKDGPPRPVTLKISGGDDTDGPYETRVRFEGLDGQKSDRSINLVGRSGSFSIEQQGSYTLEGVQGAYCTGEVGSQWLCVARELPVPTANISFNPIKDQCAGAVGVKALAELSGSPPFKVKYEVKRRGKQLEEYERTIERTREEIEFRPSTEGEVTYTFRGLSDANYRNIKLDGPTFTQVLHPVASATFDGTQGRQGPSMSVYSCQGNRAEAEVHVSGVGPFELEYAIRSNAGALLETKRVKDVKESPYTLNLDIPRSIAERGGPMTVTLTKVKDGKGCVRALTVPDLSIDVERTKPSVAFVDNYASSMLEGQAGSLPIRLSGQAPWTVRYERKGDSSPAKELRASTADAQIAVTEEGDYEIVEVRDAHCPGIVVPERRVHSIRTKPKPLAFFGSPGATQKKSTLELPPVCAGTPGTAELHLSGHFPVQITYRHEAPDVVAKESTFSSAQNVTAFRLRTETAGKHRYELVRLGDTVYSPSGLASSTRPQRMAQEVYALPKATYKASDAKSQRVSLCQGESPSSAERSAVMPVVSLEGTPPFTLEFAIKDSLDITRKQLTRTNIMKHEHKIDVGADEFSFDRPGKWNVELVRVVDGHGCERPLAAQAGIDGQASHRRALDVEIVESPHITAVGARDDYCVGESIDFVLQGTPPFSVTYDFEGHKSHATSKKTIFSRVAEKPGTLRIEAVAHQTNRCKTELDARAGLTKTIHDLPSVSMREGSHYIEDLREGNEADIVFKLRGEPPFSFTYQRKQAIDRYSRPQVLETSTVTGVMGHTHTISTAEEGTWSVVWLQDKYCSVSLTTGASKSTAAQSAAQPGDARASGSRPPAL